MATKKPNKPTGNAGRGRPKGARNKVTKAVKEMILGALDDAGGQAYLKRQALENPGPFMTLVGKVVPLQVNADVTVHDLTDDQLRAKLGELLARAKK